MSLHLVAPYDQLVVRILLIIQKNIVRLFRGEHGLLHRALPLDFRRFTHQVKPPNLAVLGIHTMMCIRAKKAVKNPADFRHTCPFHDTWN